jgi:hypothetical protein
MSGAYQVPPSICIEKAEIRNQIVSRIQLIHSKPSNLPHSETCVMAGRSAAAGRAVAAERSQHRGGCSIVRARAIGRGGGRQHRASWWPRHRSGRSHRVAAASWIMVTAAIVVVRKLRHCGGRSVETISIVKLFRRALVWQFVERDPQAKGLYMRIAARLKPELGRGGFLCSNGRLLFPRSKGLPPLCMCMCLQQN